MIAYVFAALFLCQLRAAGELSERLEVDREDNNRMPTLLTVSFGSQVRCGC